jgi:hypothetical protein
MLRPSVLKGPYGHPEVELFSALRGRKVMSRGCGVKAAAVAEVTATAAAQAIDLIVNATMMCETEAYRVEESKPPALTTFHHGQYIYRLLISLPFYQWPSAPHGAGMWFAKMSKIHPSPSKT